MNGVWLWPFLLKVVPRCKEFVEPFICSSGLTIKQSVALLGAFKTPSNPGGMAASSISDKFSPMQCFDKKAGATQRVQQGGTG